MKTYTTRKTKHHATQAAISTSTLYGTALGFFVGCFLMLPPVGPIHAAVGPWMALMLLSILGAVIGFFVGPLFSGLFEPGGALRMKRSGSPYDPVSGKAIYPARRSTGSRKQAFSPAVPDHRVS